MTPFQATYEHTPIMPTNFALQHKVALANQLVQELQHVIFHKVALANQLVQEMQDMILQIGDCMI